MKIADENVIGIGVGCDWEESLIPKLDFLDSALLNGDEVGEVSEPIFLFLFLFCNLLIVVM